MRLFLVMLCIVCLRAAAQDVLTFHNDATRSGVQSAEIVLNKTNVNSTQFGKLTSFAVAGDVYAQPLYVTQYLMGDGKLHNVLIVATAQDNIYAFDADGNNPASGFLWEDTLLNAGETWLTPSDVTSTGISPAIGIIGTPVIDRTGGTVYVVSNSKMATGAPNYTQRLHALNLADGTEKLSGPTAIQATVPGTASGGSTLSFTPQIENQRPALLLAPTPNTTSASSVFIAWGSHGDDGPYHGWVISYNAANISQQTGAWCDTPNGAGGGIWMSGGGLSTDGVGGIYGASGNGTFNANQSGTEFSDSMFKLTLAPSGFAVSDWFAPYNEAALSNGDLDMGVGGAPVILPNQSGPYPHLMLTADKQGNIYLLNRDNLGQYNGTTNTSIQTLDDGGQLPIHSNLVFFNNGLYLAPSSGPVTTWPFNPTTGLFSTVPSSTSTHVFPCGGYCSGNSGSNFTISANGVSNGIVWALDYTQSGTGPVVLYAFDASNLASELYDTTQAAGLRDQAPIAVKFCAPTVANGKAFVPGRNAVVAYGLLSSGAAAAPTMSPTGGIYTTPQMVSLVSVTPGASIYYTTNATAPTTSSTLYTAPILISTTTTLEAIAAASTYTNSPVSSATYTIAPPPTTTTPVLSLASGSYLSPQIVSISDLTAGAIIYYTTNGTMPTVGSTVYSGPITLTTTTTLTAIAQAPGDALSAVATATYTLANPGINLGTGFTGATLDLNGSVTIVNGRLRLTNGGTNERSSAYFPTLLNVTEFTSTFDFQLTSPNADGFTFVVQDAGPTALGLGGGGLGYAYYSAKIGVTKSVAIKFDLYNSAGEGNNSTGIYTNGAAPKLPAINLTGTGINLHSGDEFQAQLTYNGTTLTVVITDLVTHAAATQTYTINIPATVGANTAYVGFTAGTGGQTSTQDIISWIYSN